MRFPGTGVSEKKVGEPGSISHGTMREEDLIPTFLSELERLDPQRVKALKHKDEYRSIFRWVEAGCPSYAYRSKAGEKFQDRVSYFLNEVLFDALNDRAPDGYYFGSHPGDGSDYGFWASEDD